MPAVTTEGVNVAEDLGKAKPSITAAGERGLLSESTLVDLGP